MRFLYFDRIVEADPPRRMAALKCVSLTEEFLPGHHQRAAVMPPTLMIESIAQVGGWLNIVSRRFAIHTVLALVEGVRVRRSAVPGDTLRIDVMSTYSHSDGATVRGEVRIRDELVLEVDRMVFVNQASLDERHIQMRIEQFAYVSGGFVLPKVAVAEVGK